MRVKPLYLPVLLLLLTVCLQFPPIRLQAEEDHSALATARRLQQTYEKMEGLVADFRQVATMQLSAREKNGQGRVTFLKPGHMRWDYYSPDRQVLISNGDTLTMYFEKSKQMVITAAKEYLQSDVVYSFFTGTGNIMKDFIISAADEPPADSGTGTVIKLIPTEPHPNIRYIYIWPDDKTSLINRIRIVDHFDTVTDLFFENVRLINSQDKDAPVIDPSFFTFTPPPDTEIITQ
jgi:outer membrane lipoprotein carrier protein